MTPAQVALLRCIKLHGSSGWGEVALLFSSVRNLPRYLEASILKRTAEVLTRRKLITETDDGPILNEAGEWWLKRSENA